MRRAQSHRAMRGPDAYSKHTSQHIQRTYKAGDALPCSQTYSRAELHNAADPGAAGGVIQIPQQAKHHWQCACSEQMGKGGREGQTVGEGRRANGGSSKHAWGAEQAGPPASTHPPPTAMPVSRRSVKSCQ